MAVLRRVFSEPITILEIGSGTGQHAVYFGKMLPHLVWQPSDVQLNISGIQAWIYEAALENVLNPIVLDVNHQPWPQVSADAVFSANAVHIMSWPAVCEMFQGISRGLKNVGLICLYGPFNYRGSFTSESNARFDAWLKANNPQSGIRDFEALNLLAEAGGFVLQEDIAMPANNRILVWRKNSSL